MKSYHEMITDVWKYFRKFAEKDQLNEQDWQQAIDEANAIMDQHNDHRLLAGALLADMFGELQRRVCP